MARTGAVGGLAVCTATVVLALVPPATAEPADPGRPRYSAGSDGTGDPYFPLAGNGGYDVQHYDLDLTYIPPAAAPAPLEGRLEGTATIELVTTQGLDRFNLDLRGLTATSVEVDGKPARFTQEGTNELVVTPRPKLEDGDEAEVVVTYGGTTRRPTDVSGALYGWVTTRDGAMVANEADGAATWFPVNDHPTDKATFSFDVTVPEGLVAVANGLLADRTTVDGWTTWSWDAPDLMAPYLATATIGNFQLRASAAGDVPVIDALDRDLPAAGRTTSEGTLGLTPDMMTFFEGIYGPYPFVAYGSIVDDDTVGYALETQTRSLFSRVASESTAAHELAHSWVGNAVSPERWADIWLNEGWAAYSEQLWTEHRNGATTEQRFDALMARPASDPFWDVVIADPGPVDMFAEAVYDRGAGTLHALRLKIGDGAFYELADEWVARHDDGTASTADFEALAEEVSGQDLESFFTVWLHTAGRPTSW
nr:peptidase M1 [Georgenia sp. SUBG003]